MTAYLEVLEFACIYSLLDYDRPDAGKSLIDPDRQKTFVKCRNGKGRWWQTR